MSRTNWLYGAIAQSGERLHGMQEVSGSIPLSSTKFFNGLERVMAMPLMAVLQICNAQRPIYALICCGAMVTIRINATNRLLENRLKSKRAVRALPVSGNISIYLYNRRRFLGDMSQLIRPEYPLVITDPLTTFRWLKFPTAPINWLVRMRINYVFEFNPRLIITRFNRVLWTENEN